MKFPALFSKGEILTCFLAPAFDWSTFAALLCFKMIANYNNILYVVHMVGQNQQFEDAGLWEILVGILTMSGHFLEANYLVRYLRK